MNTNSPSQTAMKVALRRAAHQIMDNPRVFEDPLALRILGLEDALSQNPVPLWLKDSTVSRVLRASMAARSRFAEDELGMAVESGVRQYVVLGAGLDTFACRNPYENLRVFEVDHPDTQIWKRSLLNKSDIDVPSGFSFSPVDFEKETLDEGLIRAGFQRDERAFFSWLGVTMYLSEAAIDTTLQFIASMPEGSAVVFDYMIFPSLLGPIGIKAFEGLSRHVAEAGEPFQSFFDPYELKGRLFKMGFTHIEDMGPDDMNASVTARTA
jgi:methyltransferase (TIGR00027 family)